MKPLRVQKYGGTSVGSVERIMAVAKRVKAQAASFSQVIVVSAMGDTTDKLVQLVRDITSEPTPREYDALISTGENISASLLSISLNSLGIPAVSLTGSQAGIETEELHAKAKILDIKTTRIERELSQGKVVVITGFQGVNPNADVTTIGRGGSDTSAVALAAALQVAECEIYTDVDGVYTTDPRQVAGARKLHEISYEEMLEMASLGAKVLHPRAVECAKENKITLHVRSSFNTSDGTRVKEAKELEVQKPVVGVAAHNNEAIVSVLGVPDHPGVAGALFTVLASKGISVDMIIQNVQQSGSNNISFSLEMEDLDTALSLMETEAKRIGATVISDRSIAKISCIGIGMISKPGIAARMFEALGKAGINILRITTSEIKISCAIPRVDSEKAVAVLHEAFDLDRA